MNMQKPEPGTSFPAVTVPALDDGALELARTSDDGGWTLVVVYRGKHCPLCTRYLQNLNDVVTPLQELNVMIVAVSADSQERALAQMEDVTPRYRVGYDLSLEQMKTLGLYISSPTQGLDAERPFAEPGLFLVDENSNLKLVDISNVPFARPDLPTLASGMRFMRSRTGKYPANGTYA